MIYVQSKNKTKQNKENKPKQGCTAIKIVKIQNFGYTRKIHCEDHNVYNTVVTLTMPYLLHT